jgi:hypothetical protein
MSSPPDGNIKSAMETAHGLPLIVLGPDPRSAWKARRLASEALTGHAEGDTLHNALLVVSELVSNAVAHAGTEISVGISLKEHGVVRIEVSDGRTWPPRPRAVTPDSVGGRGLLLVEALSDRWGVETRAEGKTVWAEIAVVDAASRAASRAAANASDPVRSKSASADQLVSGD